MKIVRTPPLLLLLLCGLASEAGCHSVESEDLGVRVEVAGLNVISARLSPRDPKRPTRDPGVRDGVVDGVYAETGIPCVRMGRCPNGEKCQYDQDEDANRGAPYCVDPETGEKTGNVPRRWPWGAR